MRARLVLLTVALTTCSVAAQESPQTSSDETAIRKTGEEYVEAFNKREAKTLAGFWSEDAVYTNRVTGERVNGRDAIEKSFIELFELWKDAKLDVTVESIQFISPSVAVEHGTARLLAPDQDPAVSEYAAVYVRRDGNWLLDRVTDEEIPATKTHYEQLKDLEWLIGSWVDEGEGTRIVTDCDWTRNKNFITRSFTVSIEDRIDMAGMQIIGWDAAENHVRSWTFDSDGGFAEGTWTKRADRWHIRKSGVLADGSRASSLNVLRYLNDNAFTIQSVQRTVEGEILPNIDEIRVVRVQ